MAIEDCEEFITHQRLLHLSLIDLFWKYNFPPGHEVVDFITSNKIA